jgi:hypothetical protein
MAIAGHSTRSVFGRDHIVPCRPPGHCPKADGILSGTIDQLTLAPIM